MPRSTPLLPVALASLALIAAPAPRIAAQTLDSHHIEARFQLDLKVPHAALQALLPAGFNIQVATEGAAKDANLRAIFIERIGAHAPDLSPLGRGEGRLVQLVAPVTDPSGSSAQLVIFGLTSNREDAPGPFEAYMFATTHSFARSTIARDERPPLESQDWVFESASGERLEMHIVFQGMVTARRSSERTFYSAADPSLRRIVRQEQILDIVRNVTTNPLDRVRTFEFRGGGGGIAALFDGTEQVLSWDYIPWVHRSEMLP